MELLYQKLRAFQGPVCRNIVSLLKSANLFDDLVSDEGLLDAAIHHESRTKSRTTDPGIIARGFEYTAAIGWPFSPANFNRSRFSDGTFPALYCSEDIITSIYETAFHALAHALAVDGHSRTFVRERAVYKIDCDALLVDLVGREKKYPQLISNDHSFCRGVGHYVAQQGIAGISTRSARCSGINVVILRESVATNAVFQYGMSYTIDLDALVVAAYRGRKKVLQVPFGAEDFPA